MNRTAIRKFIVSIAMNYIVYYFDRNNTQPKQHLVVTKHDYTLSIDRNCYLHRTNFNDTLNDTFIDTSNDIYFEDYRIEFDGIINNKNIKSFFFIVV